MPRKFNADVFQDMFDVSDETFEKLGIYHDLLLKWQKSINLVSRNTIEESWHRHFADSAQLSAFLSSKHKVIADLGCGAGFPGLVLAIMHPEINMNLIESDERKCLFMRTVSRETDTDVAIHNMRIEDATNRITPDLITARALASLGSLLDYARPWLEVRDDLECLFLKGAQADQEVEDARSAYVFDVERYVSKTSDAASVLYLKAIRPCA